MIVKRLISQRNQFSMFLSSIQEHYNSQSFNSIKYQTNAFLQYRHFYNMSGKKALPKQKQTPPATTQSSKIAQIDMSKLSSTQQFRLIKQDIDQSIKIRQDNERLIEVLQYYSQLYFNHKRYKDAMIEFDRIKKLMEANSAFKASPNYHYVLNQLKYYFGILGRYQDAIAVNEKAFQLIKKNSKTQNLEVASELTTLGVLYFNHKNYSQARKTLESQLKITKEVCDDTFTQIIDCKNNIAIIDFVQGKYETALKTFQKNAQTSKIIMNTNNKGKKQKHYAKHFVYLEGIYEMQMHQSQNPTQKAQLKNKIMNCLEEIKQIIKDNERLLNDFHLYYETIAQHYLQANMYQLCIKFINKALAINQAKINQPTGTGKFTKSVFEISNDIAKQQKILAIANEKLGRYPEALQNYTKSHTIYHKNMLTSEAKQMLTLQSVEDFIDCCKCMFRLKFIIETDGLKAFHEGLKYIEAPLLIWNNMIGNLWNPPHYFTFIPYELNIQIAIKLLQLEQTESALNYFEVCVKEIENNQQLLCKKSKKSLEILSQKMYSVIKDLESKPLQGLPEIAKTALKMKTYSKN